MATLINGNGNPRIYAAQDADLIAALAGDITGIAQIGNKFAATAVDANTISVADGVIVTKEGRRIQLDAGSTDMFVIPTGTTGVTNYYIIGYKLTTQSDDSQIAETFVQLMSSSSETITEDTFREGATDVYVSLYRVQQNGVNLGTITGLLPELTNISELKSDLTPLVNSAARTIHYGTSGTQTYPSAQWWTGENKLTLPKGKYIIWVKTRETTGNGYISLTGINNTDQFLGGYLYITYVGTNGGNIEARFFGTGTIYYVIEAVSIV
jgi:hypothetical protein